MNRIYLDPRVSKRTLNEFFAKFIPGKDEIHTLQIYHNDALVVRIAPEPYSIEDKREVYSLSKSFCSTAVGLLCDEGKLSPDDLITGIFPDKLPENVSENLAKMRLRHVLSMNTGHESGVMPCMVGAEDAARAFLEQEVKFEPGTHFTYNTGATCLLSCIVERVTGMKTVDYLAKKLFMPLGISGVRWNSIVSGANEGGCGIHVSSDDIAKLGLLYLHKGMWCGKRILSEEWVNAAVSPVSDNSIKGTKDWGAGYGYQFWCNARGGFRGDGAFGQLCVVLPEKNMVIAVQAELGDMQREMDAVVELAEALFDYDETDELVLPVYQAAGSEKKTSGLENRFYRLNANPMGWTGVYFVYDPREEAMQAVFSDGTVQYPITAGNGRFVRTSMAAKKFKPKISSDMIYDEWELSNLAASCCAEEGKLTFEIRFLNCPHKMRMICEGEGDALRIHIGSTGQIHEEAHELTGCLN